MLIALGVFIVAYELFLAFQTDVFSDAVIKILEDFPILGVVLIVIWWAQKTYREEAKERQLQHTIDAAATKEWLNSMLQTQRNSLNDVYHANQLFLSELLKQIQDEQTQLIVEIKALSHQLSLNTSRVNEISHIDQLVNDLIDKLEKK